jgi:hypothetical protein
MNKIKKREFKMSVKKILVLSAAAFVAMGATAAMAGGPDHMAMPSEPAFQNSVYLEGHLGYAQSNWTNFNSNNVIGSSGSSLYSTSNNGKGAFTGGLDLGYNITQHIAVEGGWFYLPQVKGAPSGTTLAALYTAAAGSTAKISSGFAYMAAKLTVPVVNSFDLFGKIGVAYRYLSYSGVSYAATNPGVTGKGAYWAPVFATGLQYGWGSWLVGAQYTYLPGQSSINYSNVNFGAPNAAPEVNLYTGFLGYKFNV